MNDKRKAIIETAMTLFARNGFHTTSMQEVAENCGIAKGSLYNHFRSKEDLLFSIYKHYYELIYEKIAKIEQDKSLDPKERLVEQVHLQLKEFVGYRDFIQMQMREQAIQINDEIHQFLFKKRAESLLWYTNRINEIYGKEVKPYALDCATMFGGIIKEYFGYIIIDQKELDLEKLSRFLVSRLDDLVAGLSSKKETFLTRDVMGEFVDGGTESQETGHEALHHISGMLKELEDVPLTEWERKELKELLEELQKALKEDDGESGMESIQGILLSIAGLTTPELNKRWKALYRSLKK